MLGGDLNTRADETGFYSQERLYESVHIVLVGKYTSLKDSYMSVVKSLEHSAFRCNRKLILDVRSPTQLIHLWKSP